MLRIRQLQTISVNLNLSRQTSQYSKSVFNGIIYKHRSCCCVRPFSNDTKDKKIPSIKNASVNLMNDSIQSSEQQKHDGSKKSKSLLFGMLFTAFTLGTIWFISPTKNKPKEFKLEKKKRPIQKNPSNSKDIPKDVPYLLIGGGTASFTAFRAIKSVDPKAKVLMITNENFYPYMRPPLSKEIWFNEDKELVKKKAFKQWNGSERSLFYEPEEFYTDCTALMEAPNGGVAVARGWTVKKLDVNEKFVTLDDGTEIRFGKCLLATGAKPKLLPVFQAAKLNEKTADLVKIYRDIHDFEDAYNLFEKSTDVAVVGGGFLGSELACAMARKDAKGNKNVYQIFKEGGNMGKVLPEYLSAWTTNKVKNEGVKVIAESEVVALKENNKKLELTLNNGNTLLVDYAVIAVGVEANTDLADESGLEVDPEFGGYLVNTELQARSDIYVAGDCACFYDTKLGRRRFEHHDHAVVTGRLAGENMAGARKPYLHQSMFWSDLGPDVGYEAIGIVDSTLPTVAVFAKSEKKNVSKALEDENKDVKIEKAVVEEEQTERSEKMLAKSVNVSESSDEDFNKGVIFYLKDDIVVGVVMWNVFNKIGVARQVLMDHKKYEDLNEVAKLFTIHEE